ncbi:MAG: tRNA lysidine(34) synthetase TilS [Lachnospiraceae bacterium]|nr:tRNA lysidine(34) synthetase TilS [Lachnospiraceae bacterium]
MLQRTAQYMKQQNMCEPGDSIVLGLSGGMDSVCLFHLLKDLGYSLAAVHVHHGIRGEEADRDEAFAKNLCEKYEVPFYGFRYDVPKISKEQHLSEEEAGRMVRRKAFFQVQQQCGAKWIALAHHGNDRAETFLFNLSRGTGIKGLCSMKPVQGSIIRPLLWTTRDEIENYIEKNQYAYVEDGTNGSDQYTRNRIRHEILPGLEQINEKALEHICGAAEKLSAVSAYLDREADKLCTLSAVMCQDEVRILKTAFCKGDEVLQIPVLQKCVEYLCGSLENITEEHLKKLIELFEMQSGKEIHLPYGMVAVRTYEGIRLFYRKEQPTEFPVEIAGEGIYRFGGKTFQISIEDWDDRKNFPINSYTKCFDYDKIGANVFLRTRETGDYLEVNADHGKKSLKDYMINEKIPREGRDQVILLADGNHILWVVGKRISEYYKVSKDTTKILRVQCVEEMKNGLYN